MMETEGLGALLDETEGAPPSVLLERLVERLPDGQIYLELPNRWRRGKAPHQARPHLFSLGPTLRRLRAHGFREHTLFAHEPNFKEARFLVDLRDKTSVRDFQAQHPGRERLLPAWFYRRTAPAYAVTAGPEPAGRTWLDGALATVRAHLGTEGRGWRAAPPAVNRKGKLITVLWENSRPRWLVKVPLHPEALAGLETAHGVLSALEDALPVDHPLSSLLPRELARLEHGGVPLFVESMCPGRAWGGLRPPRHGVTDTDFPEILAALIDLDPEALGLPLSGAAIPDKAVFLSGLLMRTAPELVGVMSEVGRRLEAAAAGRPLRLRKGDLTLNNVFLEGRRVSGLIDWDDTELCRLPLSACAVLIFSWLWQREGLRRADSLARLAVGDITGLPAELGVPETLARLGRSVDDLAVGALASWFDHAYQELKHPVFRFQPARVRGLLVEPLAGLDACWAQDA